MALIKVIKGETVEDVLTLLDKYYDQGEIIAGGTDIMVAMRNEEKSPKVLIDISNIEELSYIKEEGNYIEIGSTTTFTQIVDSPIFNNNLKGFKKACRLVGSPQIRNKGTIGGNIINASAAADSVPPLIALESTIILKSKKRTREMKLEDYYKNWQNEGIKENELLTSIRFKKPKVNKILTFDKLGLRKALAISRINISILISVDKFRTIQDIKIASGALGKYPMREKTVEKYLQGEKIDRIKLDNSIKILQEEMSKRLKGRASLPYKIEAVKGPYLKAFKEALDYFNEVVL